HWSTESSTRNNVFNIVDYARLIQVLVGEAAKYLSLLLFTVLAIRLWRHVPHTSGVVRRNTLLFAGVVTLLAAAIGIVSIRHSLGRMDFYYGKKAVTSGNVTAALGLFQTSAGQWKSADAIGGQGICLMLMGETNEGFQLLAQSKAMRNGASK